MKTLFKYFIFFVVCLCVSAIATMPASFVMKQLPAQTSLKWGEVSGPWHHFSLSWFNYQSLLRKDVEVIISPMCWLTAHACVQIKNEYNDIHIKTNVISHAIEIEPSIIELGLNEFSGFIPQLLVQPEGDLTVTIDTLKLENPKQLNDVSVQITWSDVGIAGENFNLGQIKAVINYQSPYIVIDLSDQSSVLDLKGKIKIDKQGQVISNVNIKPLKGFPNTLKSLISGSMRRQADGFYSINRKQVIPKLKALPLQF